jgi:hypothetical protein
VGNSEIEQVAIEYVMQLERSAGRNPTDVRRAGAPYDVDSPPRKIEVKAFGGSARGEPIPIEDRQVQAARQDPSSFYLYVVDNVAAASAGMMRVRILHGEALATILGRCKPVLTYWPTLRVSEYDSAETLDPS